MQLMHPYLMLHRNDLTYCPSADEPNDSDHEQSTKDDEVRLFECVDDGLPYFLKVCQGYHPLPVRLYYFPSLLY